MTDAPINEGPFDTLATMGRGLGDRIASKTLASLGSQRASGRYNRRLAIDSVMDRFQQFLGQNPGTKPTLPVVATWVKNTYNLDLNSLMGAAAPAPAPASPEPAAPVQAAPAAPAGPQAASVPNTSAASAQAAQASHPLDPATQARVDQEKASLNSMGSRNMGSRVTQSYANPLLKQIYQAAQVPDVDMNRITSLTKELLGHASDWGGGQRSATLSFLRNLMGTPGVKRNQRLYAFLGAMNQRLATRAPGTNESIRRTFQPHTINELRIALRGAIQVLESGARTREQITESLSGFLDEQDGYNAFDQQHDTQASQNSAPLQRSQLDRVFGVVASALLNSGQAQIQQNAPAQARSRQQPPPVSTGGYAPGGQPAAQAQSASTAPTALAGNTVVYGQTFQSLIPSLRSKQDANLVTKIIGSSAMKWSDLKYALAKRDVRLDSETMDALMRSTRR